MTSATPAFSTVPAGVQQQPTPFQINIEEHKVQGLKELLRRTPVAKKTYENLRDDGSHGQFGVSRAWVVDAKKVWEEEFDWRNEEKHINSFPNFMTQITDDDGGVFGVHFTALFSTKPDAIPIAFFHGWPGSFLEFLPLMSLLRDKYTPETLPYHIVAPSLPGYAFSSDPPLDRDWKVVDTSRILHKLLLSLGFGTHGYLAQGGDIGSYVARELAATYPECKGMHLNFMHSSDIKSHADAAHQLTEQEKKGVTRLEEFETINRAYGIEHGTKPSTIGIVLASSPIAHLAWIGEKFLAWSDPHTTPSPRTILADITLYWLTGCYPTTIYPYREVWDTKYVAKPVGYSYFPWELAPVPRAWAAATGNIVFFKSHDKGGHFAALEVPERLWEDVEAFVGVAWK